MEIQETELSQVRRKLAVDVAEEEVRGEYDAVTDEYHRLAVIPGFRKGRIPREVVRGRFKEGIGKEVTQRLIKATFTKILEEKQLHPIGEPQVTDVKEDYPKSLHFEIEFETMPKLEVENYRQIHLTRVILPVTDEDVEARLQQVRLNAAEYRSVDGPATDSLFVVVDIEAHLGDRKVLDQKATLLALGGGDESPRLASNFLGCVAGEVKEFTLTLAEGEGPAELVGKELHYKAKVGEVKERILPPLDDDLATSLGDYSTLDDLRVHLRADLERERDSLVRSKYAGQIMEHLVKAYPFEVPSAFYQQQALRNTVAYKQHLDKSGQKVENMEDEIGKAYTHYAGEAASFARLSIILDEIARHESLTVSDEEVEVRIGQMAEESRKSPEGLKAKLGEAGQSQLRSNLLKDKVIDFLIAEATIE